MPRGKSFTLTAQAALGLFFIQRYRFLTIDQFARAADLNRSTASDQLRFMERHGLLSHFGNTGLAGHGKTPKAYFLTRKGWELLVRESDIPPELIGDHRKVHVDARWSPQMYHRLRTVDLMISAEIAVRNRPHLTIVQTFLEYRMVKRAGRIERETSDYVADAEISENRIIPDAALIIENIETKKRALFFLEMDMATERIVTNITRDKRITVRHKISQYDRYLQSLRYKETYAPYGDFRFFTMLFVTLNKERVENIRESTHNLPVQLAQYYRLTTYAQAMGDFLGQVWVSRSPSDTQLYPLVREAA
jgi:protein involved in plasmid replication-relaxation